MTTIAIDLLNMTLSTDSRATNCVTESYTDTIQKIFVDGNTILTGTGNLFEIMEFVRKGKIPKGGSTKVVRITRFPFKLEVFTEGKRVDYVTAATKETAQQVWLLGSGAVAVCAACLEECQNLVNTLVHSKKRSEKVVELAMEVDQYTGGKIVTVSFTDGYLYEDIH